MKKIQWVSSPHVKVKILMPDGSVKNAIGEIEMKKLKVGDIIQMERIGFGRIDEKGETIIICFSHK